MQAPGDTNKHTILFSVGTKLISGKYIFPQGTSQPSCAQATRLPCPLLAT